MTHSEVRALLSDYVEAELDLAERARLDAHLPGCERCSAELRELRATIALLRGLGDPAPPDDLAAKVMARVAAGEATAPIVVRVLRRFSEPRFAAPLAAAIVGLALFTGLQAVSPQRATPPVGPLPGIATREGALQSSLLLPTHGSHFGGGEVGLPVSTGEPDIESFLANPDRTLDGFLALSGAERDQAIRDFVQRIHARRDVARFRMRLDHSEHPLAPELLLTLQVPTQSRQQAPLPVTLTSDER